MTVEKYIDTWKSFGINSVEDYHRKFKELCLDKSFRESFQNLNYKNFWKASDIHFGTDPVCNHNTGDGILNASKIGLDVKQIRDANIRNWSAAHMMGASGYLDLFFNNFKEKYQYGKIPKICEIGSGYGCLMNYLENKQYEYTGFDLIPRFESVVEVMGNDGCLSDDQIDKFGGNFNLVYSFNVFQHLEKHQIEKYIDQTYQLLNKEEYSCAILGICLGSETFHYGQLIELPTEDEFDNMISGKFKKVFTTTSHYSTLMGCQLFCLDIIR